MEFGWRAKKQPTVFPTFRSVLRQKLTSENNKLSRSIFFIPKNRAGLISFVTFWCGVQFLLFALHFRAIVISNYTDTDGYTKR